MTGEKELVWFYFQLHSLFIFILVVLFFLLQDEWWRTCIWRQAFFTDGYDIDLLPINQFVEIHAMDNNIISSSQVQTPLSITSGQQECKYRSVIVESINYGLSLCHLGAVTQSGVQNKLNPMNVRNKFQQNQQWV